MKEIKSTSMKFKPVIGFGYFKQNYGEKQDQLSGHTYCFIIPFFIITRSTLNIYTDR